MEHVALTSAVEAAQVSCSGRRHARYPGEGCCVLETDGVLELGRLAAARFLEWASEHPEGVVSLPTGRACVLVAHVFVPPSSPLTATLPPAFQAPRRLSFAR